MPTPKLGLPTITGNMTADVVRDLNALAEAVDGKVGTGASQIPLTNNVPLKTTADMTLYINADTGSDTNNGLSSGTALKTIGAAIAKIPQIVNHTVTIHLAAGTYNEDIVLAGYSGKGVVIVVGSSDGSAAASYKISSAIIQRCSNTIQLQGIEFITTTKNSVFVQSCADVSLLNCFGTVVDSVNSGLNTEKSNVVVLGGSFSNKGYGITARYNSHVYIENAGGTGNTIGLSASQGSVIAKAGTVPAGTTAESTGAGGVIR